MHWRASVECPRRLRIAVAVLLSSALIAIAAAPAQSQDKQKEIQDLEKQIQLLSLKLTELKNEKTPEASLQRLNTMPEGWLKSLTWRSIGPANMGGRITAISVFEADPSTFWIATASGGLLKTTNNGISFEHQFDKEATVSIGDVCVAPSNREIVWVGTGENLPRNSVSYGDGAYKSEDGGKTWKNMGLKKTFQIGKILVHPTKPDTVYVGALGRLYGPNEDRGLYKTTDGGKTWNKILYIDDKTGVMDMRMHPTEPDTLLVAMYERQRDIYDTNDPIKKWGPGAGLHKTTDGGKTWKKLTKGLPSVQLGRMGLDYYRKDPNTVYLILESEKIGMGTRPQTSDVYTGMFAFDLDEAGVRVMRVVDDSPAAKAGIQQGDMVVGVDDKEVTSSGMINDEVAKKKEGDRLKVKITREEKPMEFTLTLTKRPEGGQQAGGGGRFGGGGGRDNDPNRPWGAQLGGQRENVQTQQGPNSHEYGGVYKSTDRGESWTRINSVNPRPMYFSQIRVDPSDSKYLYVLGVSIYKSSNGGETFRSDARGVHADQHALWIDPRDGRHMIIGCDGGTYVTYDRMTRWDHLNHSAIGQFYHVALDTRPFYKVYGGLQDNGTWGGPCRTRTSLGPVNQDWMSINGGDGFHCCVDPNDPDQIYATSQNGATTRRNLRTGEVGRIGPQRTQGGPQYRFNWNTPFILSHANSRIYYSAGNYVFRSLDRGNDLRPISPEITSTSQGSATALAESPRNPNVLYVGTDDGFIWVTRDGGREWKNITKNVGLPKLCCVASIEPSRYDEGRCYAAFDGHRSDLDDPFVYMTEDFGQTWKPIRSNLPWGSSRVLREDIQNPDVLYLGTEFAVWASLDRGTSWTKMNNNLPTVAVHELAQHPTTGEIVAATHGRSIWIADVTALRQTTADVLKAKAHLFKPNDALRFRTEPSRGGTNREYTGTNPRPGAQIYYSLASPAKQVSLRIEDVQGKRIRDLTARNEIGMHHVTWDLSSVQARQTGGPGGPGEAMAGGGGRGRRGAGGQAGGGRGGRGAGDQDVAGQVGGGRRGAAQQGGAEGATGGGRRGTGQQGAGEAGAGGGQRGAGAGAGAGAGGQRGGEAGPGGGQGGFGGRGGFGRGGFGGNAVTPGTYRVVLTVDDQTFTQTIRVESELPTSGAVLAAGGDDDGDDK